MMNSRPQSAVLLLNELYVRLVRSFLQYLPGIQPWVPPAGRPILARLDVMAHEQSALGQQVAEAIFVRGGAPQPGSWPLSYSRVHDLALEYMLPLAIIQQDDFINWLKTQQASSREDPYVTELLAAALAQATTHREELTHLLHEIRQLSH